MFRAFLALLTFLVIFYLATFITSVTIPLDQ